MEGCQCEAGWTLILVMRRTNENSALHIGPIQAGLTGGAGAGVVGVLVNLPLVSPSDPFFNSATVMVGALLTGLAVGIWGRVLGEGHVRRAPFWSGIVFLMGLATIIAVVGESQLERSLSYIAPIAAIVVGLTAGIFLLLERLNRPFPWTATLALLALVVGLGIGLAGFGDQESGRLELPPRANIQHIPESQL